MKQYKMNTRIYYTEDFYIPLKSENSRCAEWVGWNFPPPLTFVLCHPHNTLLPLSPPLCQKASNLH
jgi:hypothetical protein